MADLIKVHITSDHADGPGGESLWAARINATTAKLDNIPFFTTDFTLGDLVRIDNQNEIVGVVERVARTRHGQYPSDGSKEEQQEQWDTVRDYLKQHDIHAESAMPGYFAMAVPNDITDDRLEDVVGGCDVPLTLVEN